MVIDNATLTIESGASVIAHGNLTSNVDIQGSGLFQLKGTSLQNINMNGFTIPNLELDDTSNAKLTGNARIGTTMLFTNGKLQLGNNNLLVAQTATITGNTSAKFVITNGTGVLTKENLGATTFTYPVGFSNTEYNPISISNTGVSDNISIRCMQNVLDQGLVGIPVTVDFVNNSWIVTEGVAGGSILSLTSEWTGTDELLNFNRLKSGIARYKAGTNWDLPASNVLAATGTGPYTRSISNITSTGVFAVADLEKVNTAYLKLKTFLQGCYTGNSSMSDGLRVLNVIPLTQPYSSALNPRFARFGIYDGSTSVNETVPSTSVFDVTGTNDDIVDWVYVALLDGANPATILQTRAALIQRDGDIVEYNIGTGTYIPLRMPIDNDGNNHILISHRNHLSVRTSVSLLLQDNDTSSYNFSSGQTQAYQDLAITTNAAMKDLGGNVFGLWAGTANMDAIVRASGPPTLNDYLYLINIALGGDATLIISNVYNSADMNLDGTVRANGPPTLNDYLFLINTVLGGNVITMINQHQ